MSEFRRFFLRFGQGSHKGKYARIPVCRRTADLRGDFADFGIDLIEHTREVGDYSQILLKQ
jgi:hypothetical protein